MAEEITIPARQLVRASDAATLLTKLKNREIGFDTSLSRLVVKYLDTLITIISETYTIKVVDTDTTPGALNVKMLVDEDYLKKAIANPSGDATLTITLSDAFAASLDSIATSISNIESNFGKVKTSSADAVPGFTYDKIIVEGILTKNKAASDTFGEVLQLAVLDKSVESINVIEVVENGNHAATVTIPYGYFNKIANIRSTLSSLTLKMSELPDTDHAYSFHATMTPLSDLGITTFKVVGPGNSILAIGDTLTSKVIRFSADQLNHLYKSLADQTLVTATALISYVTSTHTLSVGTETIVLDGAATEDAYFVCSAAFGVVTAIGATEFDVPTLYRDVTWLGTAPALVGGKTYEISVVNGCGVIGGSV